MTSLPPLALTGRTVRQAFRLNERPLDIFHSYVEVGGKLSCATRRYITDDSELTKIMFNGDMIDYGEDPRAFVFEGKPAVVSVVALYGYDYRNHLYRFDLTGVNRAAFVLPKGMSPGKNWTPFTFPDGSLGIIHSFDPLVVLREIRREDGIVIMEAVNGLSSFSELGPQNFSAYRGGTCGLWHGDYVFGIGHTTRYIPGFDHTHVDGRGLEYLRHRPFGWVLDLQTMTVFDFDIEGPFPAEFEVVDPTSLIRLGAESFEVFTTEVNRHFIDLEGRGEAASYRFELAPEALADIVQAKKRRLDVPPAYFRFASAKIENNRIVADLAGVDSFIVFGPYIKLSAGSYKIRFHLRIEDLAAANQDARLFLDVATANLAELAIMPFAISDLLPDAEYTLVFDNREMDSRLEFRVRAQGFSQGTMTFDGVTLSRS
jgi:hypothetical protein